MSWFALLGGGDRMSVAGAISEGAGGLLNRFLCLFSVLNKMDLSASG